MTPNNHRQPSTSIPTDTATRSATTAARATRTLIGHPNGRSEASWGWTPSPVAGGPRRLPAPRAPPRSSASGEWPRSASARRCAGGRAARGSGRTHRRPGGSGARCAGRAPRARRRTCRRRGPGRARRGRGPAGPGWGGGEGGARDAPGGRLELGGERAADELAGELGANGVAQAQDEGDGTGGREDLDRANPHDRLEGRRAGVRLALARDRLDELGQLGGQRVTDRIPQRVSL